MTHQRQRETDVQQLRQAGDFGASLEVPKGAALGIGRTTKTVLYTLRRFLL